MRALELVTSQPWLITTEALEMILAIAERTNDVDALATRTGRPLVNTRDVEMRDGIAIVSIVGPIFRYANLFTEISGATSTQMLARDLRVAFEDPLVRGVVLDINSPGGQAAGIHELAEMVYAARGSKPIVTYSGGEICSAAIWIGSAADEIIIDRTTIAGSIGAKLSLVDTSEAEARAGRRRIEIVSSQSPDKVLNASQDEGRAKIQKIVDDLAAVFVESVARNRDVDVQTVLTDFGRGGLMVGQNAVDAGLVDRLGSLESVIAELSDSTRNPQRRSFVMKPVNTAATPKGPIIVATTEELRAALDAGHTGAEITIQTMDLDAIKTTAKNEGIAEEQARSQAALTEARTQAVTAERKRISDLQAIGMKGFETELAAAITNGTDVATFAVDQTKLVKTRGVSVASLKTDAPAPVAHGGAQPGDGQTSAGSGWGKIVKSTNDRHKPAARRA